MVVGTKVWAAAMSLPAWCAQHPAFLQLSCCPHRLCLDGMAAPTGEAVYLTYVGLPGRCKSADPSSAAPPSSYLSKYCALLNDAGYPTISGIAPGTAVFSPTTHAARLFAAGVLDCVVAATGGGDGRLPRRVALYGFSNGAGCVLHTLGTQWRGSPCPCASVLPKSSN